MLDQSFSSENFRKILDFENRKGRNLEKEFFPEVFELTKAVSEVNNQINNRLTYRLKDDLKLAELKARKKELKDSKETLLTEKLEKISNNLINNDFKFSIKKIEKEEKPVYTIEENAESYFAMKQLQYNVRKSFNVKQANRFAIVNQIRCLLTDNFPKVVLRTDIKSFYESIDHDRLLLKINDNSILSFLSKRLIWNILKEYLRLSNNVEKKGIPRGIGVSAYMAELYMEDIDKEINTLDEVTYYARYVDDIISIFTPTSFNKIVSYKEKIKAIIESNNSGLKMNEALDKTQELQLIKSNEKGALNFLGYKFEFENLRFQQIKLTDKKINKYRERIKTTLSVYTRELFSDPKAARRMLIHRFNFLTSNTRLENNKDNVLVGIYYSNSLLTEKLEDLTVLDEFLYEQIDLSIANLKLRSRLKLFSFKRGFKDRTYFNSGSKRKKITLKEILQPW